MALEEKERDLVEGRLDGIDLGEDINAVLVLRNHFGYASDLTFDPAESGG